MMNFLLLTLLSSTNAVSQWKWEYEPFLANFIKGLDKNPLLTSDCEEQVSIFLNRTYEMHESYSESWSFNLVKLTPYIAKDIVLAASACNLHGLYMRLDDLGKPKGRKEFAYNFRMFIPDRRTLAKLLNSDMDTNALGFIMGTYFRQLTNWSLHYQIPNKFKLIYARPLYSFINFLDFLQDLDALKGSPNLKPLCVLAMRIIFILQDLSIVLIGGFYGAFYIPQLANDLYLLYEEAQDVAWMKLFSSDSNVGSGVSNVGSGDSNVGSRFSEGFRNIFKSVFNKVMDLLEKEDLDVFDFCITGEELCFIGPFEVADTCSIQTEPLA